MSQWVVAGRPNPAIDVSRRREARGGENDERDAGLISGISLG
jgi:hypothetical protein